MCTAAQGILETAECPWEAFTNFPKSTERRGALLCAARRMDAHTAGAASAGQRRQPLLCSSPSPEPFSGWSVSWVLNCRHQGTAGPLLL